MILAIHSQADGNPLAEPTCSRHGSQLSGPVVSCSTAACRWPTQRTSSTDGTANYTYDTIGQLTGATYTYQTEESYSYDPNGNRTNGNYTTGTNNRLTTDGTYTYQYDSEGNRTARFVDNDSSGTLTTGDTDVTEYTWDYRNRLVSVTSRDTAGGSATQVVDSVVPSFAHGREGDASHGGIGRSVRAKSRKPKSFSA